MQTVDIHAINTDNPKQRCLNYFVHVKQIIGIHRSVTSHF